MIKKQLVVVLLAAVIGCFAIGRIGYAETVNYTYDTMGRLSKATYGDGTVIEYSYDKMGNRQQKTVLLAGVGPVMLWNGAPVDYFPDPQSAHDNAAAAGKTIRAWGMTFSEDLDITKTVSLAGGYQADYTGPSGFTTIEGKMTVGNGGSATVSNFVVR
jgi:YD repeat-containing protein